MAENKETSGTLRDKFRSLLSLNKAGQAKAPPTTSNKQLLDSNEFWLDISPSAPLETRIEKIKEAMKVVESEVVQDSIIKNLWCETKDLLQSQTAHEVRLFELSFMRYIIKGQYRRLGILRAVFFQALQEHTILEDGPAVIQTFETLSENGKDIQLFEQEVGPLLFCWLKTMKGNVTLLSLLVNVIKFNSSYLDQEVIVKVLELVCELCSSPSPEKENELGLQVVDAVICYSSLPPESLYPVTVMLCHTLNMKKFCSESWKLMRKLLGTHLGHSCVSTMCCILQSPRMLSDWPRLRSAVFFIGMGLWGSVRVKSLKHTAQSVLPSFHRALLTKNLELAFEVTLTIQRLVRKFGHELQTGAWDHVLDIVSSLLELVDENSSKMHLPAAVSLKKGTHEIITFIEKLIESEVYDGPVERLFAMTERCADDRPDDSVFMLIAHKMQAINPTKQSWILNLLLLLNRFYTGDTRPNIRLKTLEVLNSVLEECMQLYEEELVTEVLITTFGDISMEHDLVVKTRAVQLLIRACLLASRKCLELFSLLKGILDSGWMGRAVKKQNEKSFIDIEEVVHGLVDIFKQKLKKYPGSHTVDIFHLIIMFFTRFYSVDNTDIHPCLVKSRIKAFELLLSLRANDMGQLCIKEDPNVEKVFSSYVSIGTEDLDGEEDDDVGYVPLSNVLDCVLSCLRKESYWPVLECVFSGLCGILQNRFIIVGTSFTMQLCNPCLTHLENLSTTLCSLMSDSEIVRRKITNLPAEYTRADIQSSVLSVLSCLVCYHRWLEVTRQRQILRCLESGFTSRCARLCIGSLTLCLVEMPRDTLLRVLPSVLLRLSQMSATVLLATAVLELLATLAQLPGLYSNFVEEQYMSVFAVALQYTNPSKFSRYVVSLAHYVIATWFAKCRMGFRPDFVSFITRNLHAVNRLGVQTEDSKKVDAIRNDLMETCIDVMARYTFSNCSAPPRRSALAQFLFDKGPTATWLLGNKLITITTSLVDKMTDHISTPFPDNGNLTPPWPRPTFSYSRQFSSEAPAKLQSGPFASVSTSARQRHKSGGDILKRSVMSPSEPHTTKANPASDSSKKRIDFSSDASGEPRPQNVQNMLTQGWAEIYIRRPSGNTAWSMRIQNQLDPLDGSTVIDVLNLQTFLKEIKAREEARNQPTSLQVPVGTPTIPEQISPSDSHPVNEYMDMLTDRKVRSASNPDERTGHTEISKTRRSRSPDFLSPRSMAFSTSSTPPPLPSSPPMIRHRSHTVSTSKGCAAQAAAANAKLAAERKRAEFIPEKGVSGNTLSSLTDHSIQDSTPDGQVKSKFREIHSTSDSSVQQHRQVGINSPCFVFLQLFQSAISTETIHRPILLPNTPGLERGIQVLDRIPPYDTWATGVIYVAPGNGGDGNAILSNESGSPRYQELLQGLGDLVCLPECDPASTFLSGLDKSGEDGDFTYVWKEDQSQMVFHITTLMPTRPSDPGCKTRHIGNDYVIIAYDDDDGRYVPGCVIQGQFRSVEIVITPLDNGTNHVRYVFHQETVEKTMGRNSGPWLISDGNLPVFVRQLALHANIASFVCLGATKEYSHKALARLRQIKRIRSRALQETERETPNASPTGTPKLPRRDHVREEIDTSKLEEFSDFVR